MTKISGMFIQQEYFSQDLQASCPVYKILICKYVGEILINANTEDKVGSLLVNGK